jgi:hypothetical protein
MPAKKKPSKSAFIRSLPATMTAPEVVKKGKAAGVMFSTQLVYNVRGRGKPKAKRSDHPGLSKATARPASKAAFVRSLPPTVPAKAVVAQAKAAGVTLMEKYVYVIRALAKGKRPGRAGVSVPRPIATPSSAESLLKALGAELGLARAIAMLEGERERVRKLIRG